MNLTFNYRHIFHAGNFADVHKHSILTLLLIAMQRKPTPFFYLETHAGAGLYDLTSPEAHRSPEWKKGIDLIWQRNLSPQLTAYLTTVAAFNKNNYLNYYPGSPLIAQNCLRAIDRIILFEANFLEAQQLETTLKKSSNGIKTLVRVGDGYAALNSWLPQTEKRGVIFIDPPFENNDEFKSILTALAIIQRLFATACVMIWYPLKELRSINKFHQALKASGLTKLLLVELKILPDDVLGRFHGSALLLHNPPWQLDQEINLLNQALAKNFACDPKISAKVYWLNN